jgi:DNA-binding XRE family transcriptional regulator
MFVEAATFADFAAVSLVHSKREDAEKDTRGETLNTVTRESAELSCMKRSIPQLVFEKYPNSSMEGSLSNYIRTHRKRAGLSQRELARVLDYETKVSVFRHERVLALPPLLTAIRYEVLFAVPISELFAGMREAVEQVVANRLSELEQDLRRTPETEQARRQTLDWIVARRASLPSPSQ